MTLALRVVVASSGSAQFQFLHSVLANAGHLPLAYLVSRSMRPSANPEPDILDAVEGIVADLPPGMDLLLPGGPAAVADMLAGYAPDVLLVFGFNWRLPHEVLDLPRLGTLNVHPSALPKHRGPSPVPWAIRNGDLYLGMTVHRMTGRIDAGPVLAQVCDMPIPDQVTPENVWELQKAVLPGLVAMALDRAAAGDPGMPQDESAATYAGFPPPEWYRVTWQGGRRDIHNQLRVLRFLGATVNFQGREARIKGTSLTNDGGVRFECDDGPLWVTFAHPGSGET
jgi:methionyl-tRNA formyltransferase